jgi:hypothetical protein
MSSGATAVGLGPVPTGLSAVKHVMNHGPLDPQTIANPYISGFSDQLEWKDIEPTRGAPDWSVLDPFFAAAESKKKWVRLILIPGMGSPAWALEGARTDKFARQYGPMVGQIADTPMPWDPVYTANWLGFLKQIAERYGKSPAFRAIAACGPTSVTAEMTMPAGPGNLKRLIADGYTPRRFIEAWRQTFEAFATIFPSQYITLSVGEGAAINDQGVIDHGERERTREAVVRLGASILGPRFILMNNGLHSGPKQHEDTVYVRERAGQFTTGLQVSCPVTRGPACAEKMGNEADPADALRQAVERGLIPNSMGQHAKFIEVYEPDVDSPLMQQALRDEAAKFPK